MILKRRPNLPNELTGGLDSLAVRLPDNEFLIKNSRYKKSGLFDGKTPEAQSQALDRAFYSETTNPKSKVFKSKDNYSKGILSIINAYKLRSLDGKRPPGFEIGNALIITAVIGGSFYLNKNKFNFSKNRK